MTNDKTDDSGGKCLAEKGKRADSARRRDPQWANGLKRIYDSVLEEPLPDSFKDLLSRLDDGKSE